MDTTVITYSSKQKVERKEHQDTPHNVFDQRAYINNVVDEFELTTRGDDGSMSINTIQSFR